MPSSLDLLASIHQLFPSLRILGNTALFQQTLVAEDHERLRNVRNAHGLTIEQGTSQRDHAGNDDIFVCLAVGGVVGLINVRREVFNVLAPQLLNIVNVCIHQIDLGACFNCGNDEVAVITAIEGKIDFHVRMQLSESVSCLLQNQCLILRLTPARPVLNRTGQRISCRICSSGRCSYTRRGRTAATTCGQTHCGSTCSGNLEEITTRNLIHDKLSF